MAGWRLPGLPSHPIPLANMIDAAHRGSFEPKPNAATEAGQYTNKVAGVLATTKSRDRWGWRKNPRRLSSLQHTWVGRRTARTNWKVGPSPAGRGRSTVNRLNA